MRIVIEALGIERPGGGRTATLNLLHGLLEVDPDTEYVVLLSRPERFAVASERVRQVVLPIANRLAYRLAAEVYLPLVASRHRADLVHNARSLTTVFSPCRRVVTVYDLTVLVHPELYPAGDVAYWRVIQPKLLRRAGRVIAISQATANDLMALYALGPPQVEVIYPGYDPAFSPGPAVSPEVLARYRLSPGFVLHVGSIGKKKNLLPLVRAVERLRREGWAGQLVLVGRVYDSMRDGPLFDYIRRQRLESAVVVTGPVPQPDLVELYRAAGVFVFPSIHEGFGLALVEAMACGVPVVSSAGGALAEVLRGAGMLLENSSDDREIAEAIRSVLGDGSTRRALVEAGLERASRFTRRAAAQRTLELYRSVVGG